MKKLVIIGSGGHSRMIVDVAISSGFEVSGIVDINFSGQKETVLGVPVIGGMEDITYSNDLFYFVAIGDNLKRSKIIDQLIDKGLNIPILIHPSANVSNFAELDIACVIMPNASINAGCKIGKGVIINTGATIDHESVVGSYSHVAPGVNIAGRVKVGSKTFIGIGSAIIDSITIGDDVTIGANSTVTSDLPDHCRYVGHKKFLS